MFGLMVNLLGDGVCLATWADFIAGVVTSINEKVVRVHGFTPPSLILGFDRVHQCFDLAVNDVMIVQRIAESSGKLSPEDEEASEARHQAPSAPFEQVREHRSAASTKRLRRLEEVLTTSARWEAPKDGDLVLLKRMALARHKHGPPVSPLVLASSSVRAICVENRGPIVGG
jgi:hypothetical protein